MKRENISLLGYSLLGLLQQKPASGYDLRKIFTTTPMGSFSDSPGSIYPALARLEEGRFIAGRVEPGSGLRQRKMIRITRTGLAELRAWLSKPIELADVANRMNELMLRFAFLDSALDNNAAVVFLEGMRAQLKKHVLRLNTFLKTARAYMPVSSRLALESGLMTYQAQLRWTSHALAAYKESQETEK